MPARDRKTSAHHRGRHKAIAQLMRQNAKPTTLCATCHNTLDKCGPRNDGRNRNGTPCTWDAGHIVDGDPTYGYQYQCSHCNRSLGATMGNLKRINHSEPHSEDWL